MKRTVLICLMLALTVSPATLVRAADASGVPTTPPASDDPVTEPARFERVYWYQPGIEFGNPVVNSRFRISAPEVMLHPNFGLRREMRSNGMMLIPIEDSLFHLAGAELYLEVWGGHTGTAKKRVTINGRSTYELPEVGTKSNHCTHQYPVLALKLTDLVSSYNALQFACDQGTTFWGHFIVDGACLRAILEEDHPELAKAGLEGFLATVRATPAADGEAIDLALDVPEPLLERIASVDFEGYYEGYDENGNTLARDWHGMTKAGEPLAILGTAREAPFRAAWDLSMTPDQEDMAVRAVIQFKEPANLRYRTAAVRGLRTPARGESRVALCVSKDLPEKFWSRAKRIKKCTIPVDIDPERIERAELHVVCWGSGPGEVKDYFTLNGHALPVATGDHEVSYNRLPIDPKLLKQGENEIVVHSDTEHHGIEVLLPGPALMVRTSSRE